MREIKFRGKRVDNGEWVYGLPVAYFGKTYILVLNNFKEDRTYEQYPHKEMWSYEVISETVGQFTGLHDKNGKKIYEGDIVFAEARFDCANMVVVWDKGSFVLVPCEKYKNYISGCGYKDIRWLTKTVIGNIYENPELMEEINNE